MSDYGYYLTEKELAKLERRIKSVYTEAAGGQRKVVDDYFDAFVQRDAEQKALLDAGEITEEYYRNWRLAQIGRGERFNAMRDELAERATKANEVAIAYVNDTTPSIWTLNANYAAYTIENHAGNVGFTLFEENAVERLIVEQPDVMPYYPEKRAVNRGIDIAYGKRQITAQVTSSIMTGDSIGHMADALMQRITTMERTSAIRAARTACTNAMNAGRQMQFEKAQAIGIRVKKRWRCVHDARTRSEHADADGQIREINEPYEVGGEELMFPADSIGSGWNVYNCRCRSENYLPDYPRDMGMTYNEWVGRKEETDSNDYQRLSADDFKRMQNKNTYNRKPTGYDYDYVDELVQTGKVEKSEAKYYLRYGDNIDGGIAYDNYIGAGGFKSINEKLRNGKIAELTKVEQRTVQAIDKIISENALDKSCTLYRAIGENFIRDMFGTIDFLEMQKNVGSSYVDKQYASTGTELDELFSARPFMLSIQCPEGTNAFVTNNDSEREIILARNSKYKILGVVDRRETPLKFRGVNDFRGIEVIVRFIE